VTIRRLLPTFQQPPLIRQKDLARIKVSETAQAIGPPIKPNHPPVRNQEIAKLGGSNDLSC
jgi:hypothetical protein